MRKASTRTLPLLGVVALVLAAGLAGLALGYSAQPAAGAGGGSSNVDRVSTVSSDDDVQPVQTDTRPTWQQEQKCDADAQTAAEQYLQVNQHYVNAQSGAQSTYDMKFSSCMTMAEMSNRASH